MHRAHQFIRWSLPCLVLVLMGQTGPCAPPPPPPPDNGGGGSSDGSNAAGIFALSPENAVVVAGAISTAEAMVSAGSDSAAITAALVAQLSADSRVAQAMIDPGSGFVVAHFHDGETQTFQAIGSDDLAEGDIDPVDNLPNEDVAISMKASAEARVAHLLPAQAGGTPAGYCLNVIPGLSTALMASAIPHFHPEWVSANETAQIKGMLESRGYSVTSEPLQLKHFRELYKYGVLLIETHGVYLDSSLFKDITVCKDLVNMTTVPNCGGPESLFGLLTTTSTADEPAENYRDDIETGRLIRHNVTRTLVVNGVPVQTVTKQYYAVTSLYLRQHVTEPYPDGMLVMVNACKTFHNGSSSIGSFILSKSRSSQFLAWNDKLRYQYAAKAALNLFQLMTASNEKLELNGIPQLKKHTPPIGVAVDLATALAELGQAKLDIAPTGAVLERRAAAWESGDLSQAMNLLLMPYAMEWTGPSSTDPRALLGMFATDNVTVAIGGDFVNAAQMQFCGTGWYLSDSPNYFGNIVPWYFSRYGTPRPLRRWKPIITVKSNGGSGMQYEVRFQPSGRASISGASFRPSAWSKAPVPTFDLLWDKGGSSIWWKVSGESDTAEYHYSHQGTGTRVFGAKDGGGMRTDDGVTARISVDGVITYTTTSTRLSDGYTEQTDYEMSIPVSFEAPLRSNLSVAGGTEVGSDATTTWTEFFADPPFDNSEPR